MIKLAFNRVNPASMVLLKKTNPEICCISEISQRSLWVPLRCA